MFFSKCLDDFTDDVLNAIKNSDGYAYKIIEQIIKHGNDATEAIGKYGDDAVEEFSKGKTPTEFYVNIKELSRQPYAGKSASQQS